MLDIDILIITNGVGKIWGSVAEANVQCESSWDEPWKAIIANQQDEARCGTHESHLHGSSG